MSSDQSNAPTAGGRVPPSQLSQEALSLHAKLEDLRAEIGKHIVGQGELVESLIIALVSDGHILLEGVPGLAKTRLLTAVTQCIHAEMKRIQFTPDLLPSDLVGSEIYQAAQGEFTIRKGPIFTNLLLADEINRAPAKVQSALLQAMQERQVTIGDTTFDLPDPFLVLATQNPIEQEGTFPLPEAQIDRFLMKVKVNYPSFDDEIGILKMVEGLSEVPPQLRTILTIPELLQVRQIASNIFVDPQIDRYIVSLVQATRNPHSDGLEGLIEWGASPRASLALKSCARALAFLRGKAFVTPEEVQLVAPEVLRHRILVSFEAEARGVDADQIVSVILKSVPVP